MYANENRNSNIYMRQFLEERGDFHPNNKTMSRLNFVLTFIILELAYGVQIALKRLICIFFTNGSKVCQWNG